jgi:hypothetical protein
LILTCRTSFFRCFFHFKNWFSVIVFGWLFFTWQAFAQEKSGIGFSNYSGINSVFLNPSFTSNSKLFADLNVVSGGVFIDNNFVFIHKEDYSFMSFLKKNPSLPGIDNRGEGLDYSMERKPVDGLLQAQIYGPGFSVSMGKHTFGFTSKISSITSIDDLPYDAAVMMFEGVDYDSLLGKNIIGGRFETPSITWWEVGGHYSQIFREKNRNVWSFGLNARKLFAWAGGYASGKSVDYTIENDLLIYYDTSNNLIVRDIYNLDLSHLDAEVAFSVPLDYDSLYYPTSRSDFKGSGWAGDIGFTYRKNREPSDNFRYRRPCEKKYDDYVYKIGLSFIDFGNIVFKKNVQFQDYNNVSTYWRNIEDLTYESINQLTKQVSYELTGDSLAANAGNKFSIGLPASLSVQGDYQYHPNWYISGAVMMPLKIYAVQVKRPSQAILSLRYESPVFEFGVPVSLYNFKDPRIGLYARFYYFTLGTDKLGGFFGFNDFYGLDFYFAIKLHIMKGKCGLNKSPDNCNHLSF